MTDQEIEQALSEMDLPSKRRDISKRENVRWLIRNIRIRNTHHPKCFMVLDELRERL